MENNKKFSDRPRRPRIGHSERAYGENRSFGEHRNYGEGRSDNSERRSFGGDRPQRSYGDRPQRNYGEHSQRSFPEGRPQRSEGRSFGSDRPQRNFGEGRPQRSFGEGRPQRSFGEGRPQRNFGEGRPQRNFGEGHGFGSDRSQRREGRGFGDRRQHSFGEGRPQRSFSDRKPSFGGNGGFNKKKNFGPKKNFDDASAAGINRMISDRPLVDEELNSDNDLVMVPTKDILRLNKFISNSGICSRREADNFIQAGVVTVNGEVVTELGTKVNVRTDDVRFNGERLRGEEKVYIVMNKPKGYVTTASDPHADKVVLDLLKGCDARVFPIGRLDKNTTGVLMFTNDGEMAEKLTHPSYDKKKIYQVSLNKDLSKADYDQIMAGVTLTDGEIAADDLQYIDENDHRKLGIEIHSGKNRIVRRIFESLGYEVKGLDRVYFAGVTKKGLKRGEWRYLTAGEANVLKMGAYK